MSKYFSVESNPMRSDIFYHQWATTDITPLGLELKTLPIKDECAINQCPESAQQDSTVTYSYNQLQAYSQ